ncbi:MAG: hypothetical protein R3E58_14185 [Phycisphaerae bacterium]
MASDRGADGRARLSLEGLSLGDAFGECFFSSAMQQRLAYRGLPEVPWFYTDDTMMAGVLWTCWLRVGRLIRSVGVVCGTVSIRSYGAARFG